MTYIFKNLTKSKIRALFYILGSNNNFKKRINPSEFTNDDGLLRGIQARNSYNEYEYTLSVQEDNYLHISNIDGLLDIKYDISQLQLVVDEYDDIINSIYFLEYNSTNRIGIWKRKVNEVSDDLDWLKFLEYVKLFADLVVD